MTPPMPLEALYPTISENSATNGSGGGTGDNFILFNNITSKLNCGHKFSLIN